MVWIWRAWHGLHRDRDWIGCGMGGAVPKGISSAAVDEYCLRMVVEGEDAELLRHMVLQMDGVFFEHQQAVSERARKQQKQQERRT